MAGRKFRWCIHRVIYYGIAFAIVLTVWIYRASLQSHIAEAAVLSNDAPPPDVVEDIILSAPDSHSALLAAWNSGKIVHRQAAIRCISRVIPSEQSLPPDFEAIVLSAALDPDLNVRETAFGILGQRKHPALAALAAAQLHDCDQQVRLLGLNYLKQATPAVGVQAVVPLLDDSDPSIVAMSLKLLENWSGEKFGVKLSDVTAYEDEKTGLKKYPADSYEKARAGAELAKTWWAQHKSEFPPVELQIPAEAFSAMQPVPAGDFQLRDLEGRQVRLSDFRGKVVLINFWTTWCTACVSEMPELIALQRQHQDQLVILGVSLDFVPDEHGHLDGPEAVEEQNQATVEHHEAESKAESLKRIRDKVVRTVKARNINYPILLDEQNEVGGRFNGGELPTTVIVDAQGNVRRRFIGARSLPVFEALLAEARSNTPVLARTK